MRTTDLNGQQCKTSAVLWIVLVATFICASCSNENTTDVSLDYDVIATVNGEPISIQLFQRQISLNRSVVYSYFHKKYKIDNPSKFWTTQYDKEVPAEVIKKKAIDDCVEIKLQHILAKDKGIIPDITYKTFLENLKQENIRRKKVLTQNGVIYGPEQYTEKTYFDYIFSNMQIKLKTKLGQDTFHISNDELQNFHESRKSKNANPNKVIFEEFKEQIRAEFVNEKYTDMVKQMVLQADVKINRNVYDAIETK